jgi:hypothetical protein
VKNPLCGQVRSLILRFQLCLILAIPIFCWVGSANLMAQQGDLFKQHHDLMSKAIAADNIDQVRALLKTPYVIINDSNYDSSYLAQALAGSGHPEVAKILIVAGEDPKWHSKADLTLAHIAVRTYLKSDVLLPIVIEALKKNTSGVDAPDFKRIINMQTNSQSGIPGYTALYYMIIVAGGWPSGTWDDMAVKIAKILVEDAKADVNIPDKNGTTPLVLARGLKYTKLAAYLQQRGAH